MDKEKNFYSKFRTEKKTGKKELKNNEIFRKKPKPKI